MVVQSVLGWSVIVPLKDFSVAKSRLLLDDRRRSALARAMAADTLRAVAACQLVDELIVVTRDAEGVRPILPVKARVVVETSAAGIDAAVRLGSRSAAIGLGRAALVGDLPFLRSDDLADALALASQHPLAVVPDKEGTGSTMVTGRPGVELVTCFGLHSLRRHVAAGYRPLGLSPSSSLRWDVDTLEDLASPVLPLGEETAGQRAEQGREAADVSSAHIRRSSSHGLEVFAT